MAVPKRKTSKQRKHTRAANWTANAAALVECPQCHELNVAHKFSDACGYYDGKQVVEVSADNK